MSDFTKYAAVHEPSKRNGPGDGRTTALEIINDNNLWSAWRDKVILVTGCSSGIGISTVEALAATGAKIYAAARDLQKARLALSETLSNSSNKIELLEIDLGSLSSVRKAAAAFLSKESKLNILVNNAGIMAVPNLELTKDGFESQFGTNHLGHFLLFQLLKPALLAASTPSFHSRVVNVSSIGHRFAEPNFDDLELKQPGAYDPWKAYGVSKTASIWTANEIERRYGSGSSAHMSSGSAIHGHSLHPGGIQSGLQVHAQHIWDVTYSDPEAAKRVKSPEQGAATSVWAAVDKVWEGKGGKWLEDCQVIGPIDPKDENFSGAPGHSPWAFNDEKGRKLWEVSCQLVGVDGDRRS